MLGDEQWVWLEKVLNNKNDLNIIVSSIQVLPTDHIFEKWHNLPHERSRLIDLLNAQVNQQLSYLEIDIRLQSIKRVI